MRGGESECDVRFGGTRISDVLKIEYRPFSAFHEAPVHEDHTSPSGQYISTKLARSSNILTQLRLGPVGMALRSNLVLTYWPFCYTGRLGPFLSLCTGASLVLTDDNRGFSIFGTSYIGARPNLTPDSDSPSVIYRSKTVFIAWKCRRCSIFRTSGVGATVYQI
mgnify:CR=1 FL=1